TLAIQHASAVESLDRRQGAFSSTTRSSSASSQHTQVEASTVSGNTVLMQAGRDTTIAGSNVVADGALSIAAGRDLTITTSEQTQDGSSSATKTTNGLFGAGVGITVGQRYQDQGNT